MTLARLIEAVERGEWPGQINGIAREVFPYNEDWRKDHGVMAHEAFDGSLDAAMRLHDALLPGWMVACMCQLLEIDADREYTGGTKDWLVNLRRLSDGHSIDSAIADTAARAWLLAILRAMEGRDG